MYMLGMLHSVRWGIWLLLSGPLCIITSKPLLCLSCQSVDSNANAFHRIAILIDWHCKITQTHLFSLEYVIIIIINVQIPASVRLSVYMYFLYQYRYNTNFLIPLVSGLTKLTAFARPSNFLIMTPQTIPNSLNIHLPCL